MNLKFDAFEKSSLIKLNQLQFNFEMISKHSRIVDVSRLQARKIFEDKNFFDVQNQIYS